MTLYHFISRKNAYNKSSPLHSHPKQNFKKAHERKASKKRKIGDLRGRERLGGGGWKIVHTSGKILATPLITSKFWKHVFSWLRDNNIHDGIINEPDVIFGKCDIVKDYILINHILLFGKYYIYYSKCQNSLPTLRGFIARTRRVFNIELHIARKKNKLLFHLQKWEKLINELK